MSRNKEVVANIDCNCFEAEDLHELQANLWKQYELTFQKGKPKVKYPC